MDIPGVMLKYRYKAGESNLMGVVRMAALMRQDGVKVGSMTLYRWMTGANKPSRQAIDNLRNIAGGAGIWAAWANDMLAALGEVPHVESA